MLKKGDSWYIYQNNLDKACFQYYMTYGDLKYLTRRTASDKALRDKAFNITKNPKYEWYQRGLAWMVYKFFGKKASGGAIKHEHLSNKELAKELRKPIIRKFERWKVNSLFIDNPANISTSDQRRFNVVDQC